MATLTTAVNASEPSWVVDALPTTHFIQVDDEIVEIEASFAATYDGATGETEPNKLRVLRAALGSTAASHSGGATLVAVYGAGVPGGGSLTLDNLVDPPAEVTTIIAAGANVSTPGEATLVAVTASDSDPGAIGAGNVWLQTKAIGPDSVNVNATFIRNAADDGWLGGSIATSAPQSVQAVQGAMLEFDPGLLLLHAGEDIFNGLESFIEINHNWPVNAASVVRLRANGETGSQQAVLLLNSTDGGSIYGRAEEGTVVFETFSGTITLRTDPDGMDTGPHNLTLAANGVLTLKGNIIGTQAAFVANGSTVDQLRDALIASGLMAAS